ncbi:hypothetical protein B9Z55_023882 [Caenorhabditis nigoni]|uniref:Uncharacterized protein n=1 Tax=Caenorhabditis nigoni TaxID=1611254 RepID=A0A2G5SSC2_9PELO|nr:hypothetical protein B9Z55_023882 [Caenorhabditis nigoni]
MDCQSWERQKNLDGGYLTVLTSSDVQRRVDTSMQLPTLLGNFKRLNYIFTLYKKKDMYTNHHRKAQCLDFVKRPVDVIKQEFHPKTVGIKKGIPFASGMRAGQMMVILNNLMILFIISGNTHVTVLAQLRETRKTKVHKDLLANLIVKIKERKCFISFQQGYPAPQHYVIRELCNQFPMSKDDLESSEKFYEVVLSAVPQELIRRQW